MASERVRSDFEQLRDIQRRWNAEAESAGRAIQDLNSRMERLKGGDWYGDSATKFFNEMDNAIMPAMKKLAEALAEANRVTGQIAQTMKAAEDECSGTLNGSNIGPQ
jgi:WXG100 family type VII secretion target